MGGRGSGGGKRSGGGGGMSKSSTLSKTESQIRNNSFETAVLVDERGKILLNKSGGASEVRFSKADTAVMKGNVLTHNHPEGGTFSPADIETTVKYGLSEIRAVSSKSSESLKQITNKRNKKAFSSDYRDAMNREKARLSLDIMSDKAFTSKMELFRRAWLKNNSSKYGYQYTTW